MSPRLLQRGSDLALKCEVWVFRSRGKVLVIGSGVWVWRVESGGVQLVTRRWPVAAAKQAGEQMVVCVQHEQRSTFNLLLSSSPSSSSSPTTGSRLTLSSWLPLKPGLHENISLEAAENHVPPALAPVAGPLWASGFKRPPLQSARCCSPTALHSPPVAAAELLL